jgi:flavin-dependent dehydrogenase
MHVRRGGYIGLASVPGGLTNVCVVKAWEPSRDEPGGALGEGALRDPEGFLRRELARDRLLHERLACARLVTPPAVLGPLAVDVDEPSIDGLLLAGDAAGFIDPITGDGLRFAVQGGQMAADAALQALEHGWPGIQASLARARRRAFAAKWRFNKTLRTIVSSPAAIRAGEAAASVMPLALRAIVRRAGDCDLRDVRTDDSLPPLPDSARRVR